MKRFRIVLSVVFAVLLWLCIAPKAWAFCGFYVAKADSKLYNNASQVVIARDGERTILTMENDYQGEVKDFAIVVPVPVVVKEEQVHIGDPKIVERLDAFSAPRLVEYFDEDPCAVVYDEAEGFAPPPMPAPVSAPQDSRLGVTIEAKFSVGEYDILILSAKESDGLETWLNQNNYKIPRGANELLRPYIRQGMKFFVAKVNLEEFDKTGAQFLRPLMIAYESPKFMLPIRLGMINAKSEQDLLVYLLSPKGQTELTNYRTVQIPTDAEIPLFIKNEFEPFYKDLFQTAYNREGKKVAFLEYAWDMRGCDPCAAEPLIPEELKSAGVFWLTPNDPQNVFITRLHVRYSRDKFPEDLVFQETSNRQLFQGRYVLRHPYTGAITCREGQSYKRSLPKRYEEQAQTLAKLTGWKIQEIRNKMEIVQSQQDPFWRTIWP
jgi:hypothetical protein